MTDQPPGPGYWKASDGNWYPPQQAAPPAPPPAPPPPGVPGPHTPNVYGQPQVYGTQPMTNGNATAALVLGLLSIVMFWTFGVGIVVGILAVVFGILGRNRAREMGIGGNAGRATAGVVTGVLGVVGGVIFLIVIVAALGEIEFDTDPADGFCDTDRIFQDPDC